MSFQATIHTVYTPEIPRETFQIFPTFQRRAAQQYKAIVPNHLAKTALLIGVKVFEGLHWSLPEGRIGGWKSTKKNGKDRGLKAREFEDLYVMLRWLNYDELSRLFRRHLAGTWLTLVPYWACPRLDSLHQIVPHGSSRWLGLKLQNIGGFWYTYQIARQLDDNYQ